MFQIAHDIISIFCFHGLMTKSGVSVSLNSNLELDHIFCFCPKELNEATIAEKNGFKLTLGVRHTGQGTANRCMVFQENYFEFIFMDALEDAQSNPLRLDKRANWKATGSSPFGIALRGTLSNEERSKFWDYHPPYFPERTILIHKGNETHPHLPLLFVMLPPENKTLEDMKPMNFQQLDKSFLEHQNGVTQIQSVELVGPDYKWPLNRPVEKISYTNISTPNLKISVNARKPMQIEFNDLISVVSN